MVKGGVQNVNSGYLLGLHSNIPFPSSLHLYEWYTCFTMNMNGLKNWKRNNAIMMCTHQKKGKKYFLGNKKMFPLLLLCYSFSPMNGYRELCFWCTVSTCYFISSFFTLQCGKEYTLVVKSINSGNGLEL